MSERSETITVRVPCELKRRVELDAVGANMTLANYVRSVLDDTDVEPLPMLAALGRIIAIAATVAGDASQAPSMLAELRALVEHMSHLAYREVAS